MDDVIEDIIGNSPTQFRLNVSDTEYSSRGKGFRVFRDIISNTFMPWVIEFKSDDDFQGRLDAIVGDFGSVVKVKMAPIVGIRTNSELSRSEEDCFYANYIISGELCVEQHGKEVVGKPGDLVIYDSEVQTKMSERNRGSYEDLGFKIPKNRLAHVRDAGPLLSNVLIPADKMISPLAVGLEFLARNFPTTSREEIAVFTETCSMLWPCAVRYLEQGDGIAGIAGSRPTYYMQELLEYIDANIGDGQLSPRSAAQSLEISVRYVHKQFASRGTTFGTYITARRLELARRDLVSMSCRHQPVSDVAYRWGFNDVSTFIRAFKKKFGYSPGRYRARFS